MSTPNKPTVRYPLGLPKGSVRALIALVVFGSVMALLVIGREVEVSLWLINYVVLGYYFANRSTPTPQMSATAETSGHEEPPPLRLPRGTVRWLIILGFVGTAGYLAWHWFTSNQPITKQPAFFPMLSLGGFFLGRVLHAITSRVSHENQHASGFQWFQDIKAFVSIACALLLAAIILFDLIFWGSDTIKRFSLVYIIFYFGSR